jgi:hypothetical protein
MGTLVRLNYRRFFAASDAECIILHRKPELQLGTTKEAHFVDCTS